MEHDLIEPEDAELVSNLQPRQTQTLLNLVISLESKQRCDERARQECRQHDPQTTKHGPAAEADAAPTLPPQVNRTRERGNKLLLVNRLKFWAPRYPKRG